MQWRCILPKDIGHIDRSRWVRTTNFPVSRWTALPPELQPGEIKPLLFSPYNPHFLFHNKNKHSLFDIALYVVKAYKSQQAHQAQASLLKGQVPFPPKWPIWQFSNLTKSNRYVNLTVSLKKNSFFSSLIGGDCWPWTTGWKILLTLLSWKEQIAAFLCEIFHYCSQIMESPQAFWYVGTCCPNKLHCFCGFN